MVVIVLQSSSFITVGLSSKLSSILFLWHLALFQNVLQEMLSQPTYNFCLQEQSLGVLTGSYHLQATICARFPSELTEGWPFEVQASFSIGTHNPRASVSIAAPTILEFVGWVAALSGEVESVIAGVNMKR